MTFILNLAVACMRFGYAILKVLLPVQNKYVLISRLYDHTSYDMRELREALQSLPEHPRVIVLNHKERSRATTAMQILTQMIHLATAKGCIIDSYIVPVSVLKHRKSLTIVQLWHALGAVKKFGYAAIGTQEGRDENAAAVLNMHRGYTWVIAGGTSMAEQYSEAFGVAPERILPYGSPKVDFLVSQQKREHTRGKLLAKYPELAEKKTILYAPTFRKGTTLPIERLIESIDSERYNLAVKLHPLDRQSLNHDNTIIDDPEVSTIEWLQVANYVITDYSAVVFEAATREIPMFFYTFDLESYQSRRGLFVDLPSWAPGVVSGDTAEIVDAIEANRFDTQTLAAFRSSYIEKTDGRCTERIVALASGRQPHEID